MAQRHNESDATATFKKGRSCRNSFGNSNSGFILTALSLSLGGVLLLVVYLFYLYHSLETAFKKQTEFVPLRIYSDVSRVSPAEPRKKILTRLKDLGYRWSESGSTVSFQLHSLAYPLALIPENSPTVQLGEQLIILHFDSSNDSGSLVSIRAQDQELSEIYLEPELVATVARSGENRDSIREWVAFNDIPAHVWKAVIAIEDQHFLEHKGFDPRGLIRALWVNLRTLSLAQGGSTLTQQLVKNLMERKNKNVFRKINEIFLSIALEVRYEKEQILERYFNELNLGQVGNMEVRGIAEGAKHFFGKDLKDLNLAEAALLAGLIRGPTYYSPYKHFDRAKKRQLLVLEKMVETGQIDASEATLAGKTPLSFAPPPTEVNKAPWFVDFTKAELVKAFQGRMSEEELFDSRFRVYTSLDLYHDREARKIVQSGVSELEKTWKLSGSNRLEAAFALSEPKTGLIRSLVGGRDFDKSNFNRILNMKRQAGSTFKPIVYLAALIKGRDERGRIYGPGLPLEDAPWKLTYDHGKQTWIPKNYDPEYRSWISMRTALAHSINTVAARIAHDVGLSAIVDLAHQMGITGDVPAVPAISLGAVEVTPVELLSAYSTLANRGERDDLSVIRAVARHDSSPEDRPEVHHVFNPKQVFDPDAAALLTEMMTSVFDEGTARSAIQWGFDLPAAGKTGTTSNYRDAWFAGFTTQFAGVAWVGFDQETSNGKAPKLTGASAALPIWSRVMKSVHDGIPPSQFEWGDVLEDISIDQKSGNRASFGCSSSQVRVEKYRRGKGPTDESCASQWPSSVLEASE